MVSLLTQLLVILMVSLPRKVASTQILANIFHIDRHMRTKFLLLSFRKSSLFTFFFEKQTHIHKRERKMSSNTTAHYKLHFIV